MTTMNNNYCILSHSPAELRAMTFRGRQPLDFLVRRYYKNAPQRHDVYVAKIEQCSPAMGGVFVCLGEGGKAFMSVPKNTSLRSGGLYPVMVTRSAIDNKPPRVTMDIVFTSARLMLIPSKKGVHLSYRAKKRALQTQQLLIHAFKQKDLDCFLIRESAMAYPTDALLHEARFLQERYKAFSEAVRLAKKPGFLKYAPDYLDWFLADIIPTGEVHVGDEALFKSLRQKWHQVCPDLSHNIKAMHRLEADQILDKNIKDLTCEHIKAENIGKITIHHTEALTAIDVNAFSGHRKNNRYELSINLQLVPVIIRQLRLRNIGGPIVIDFLKMKEKEAREAVEAEMKKFLKDDPLETNIMPISALGLMEMTREKTGMSVAETLLEKPKIRPSIETMAVDLIRLLLQKNEEYPNRKIIIHCHHDFLSSLKDNKEIFDVLSPDILTKIQWKNDSKNNQSEPFITISGISEPFYSYE